MSLPDITLVVGIDFKTLQQLEVSHRTWKKFQSQIYRWPWVVFIDGCCPAFTSHSLNDLVKRGVVPPQTRFVPWPQCIGGNSRSPKYESQRERMLSGHVYVPALTVKTPWYCKLDTDALATRASDWPIANWFQKDSLYYQDYFVKHGKPPSEYDPVVVAPGWNYSKGIRFTDRLDDWSDTIPELAERPRLNIPHEPEQLRVGHARWCSWNSFYLTDWAAKCVEHLKVVQLSGLLPVPSQDTFHWHCAERAGRFVRKVNMKKHGWTNVPKLANLIEQVQSIMRGEEQEAMVDG